MYDHKTYDLFCEYIELAKQEICDIIEEELNQGEICDEGAEFLHHCLENVKHLKKMKKEMEEETSNPRMMSSDVEISATPVTSLKSPFGGI